MSYSYLKCISQNKQIVECHSVLVKVEQGEDPR